MADLKISQLTDGGASQATDEYVIARSGANYRIDGASVAAAATSVGTLTSLTVSGDLTVDTSTLKVDSTNNRVGIGTASPAQALHVSVAHTNYANAIRVQNTATSAGATASMIFTPDNGTTGLAIGSHSSAFTNANFAFINNQFNTPLLFYTNDTERMRLDASGNLGLGVTPSAWSGFTVLETQGGSFGASGTGTLRLMHNTYYDGSNWKYKNTATASRYELDGNAHVWYRAASGTAGNTITWTQAMTLDASGRLGIGTTSPGYRLDLGSGSGAVGLSQVDQHHRIVTSSHVVGTEYHYGAGTVYGYNYANAAGYNINAVANVPMLFYTNNAERARITSDGAFLVGTTSASSRKAYFKGGSTNVQTYTFDYDNASGSVYVAQFLMSAIAPNDTTSRFLTCADSGTDRLYIFSNGTVNNSTGTYGTISDERLKQDIVDAGSAWDDLKAVRFRKYRMKSDVEANPDAPAMLGVVAQELEQVMPGLVDEHPVLKEQEVTDEDGNVTTEQVQVGTTKTVKSSILLMKAAVALQEAMARIEALEARLEALEA